MGRNVNTFYPTEKNYAEIKIMNKSIKAFLIPRNDIEEVILRDGVCVPGVYLLLGHDDLKPKVYVGETDKPHTRFPIHKGDKEWLHEILFFTRGGEYLNRTELHFLEREMYHLIIKIGRYGYYNQNVYDDIISESSKDDCLEFFKDIKQITNTLGYKLFTPINNGIIIEDPIKDNIEDVEHIILYYTGTSTHPAKATGRRVPGGFLIFKDSIFSKSTESIKKTSAACQKFRLEIEQDGTLIENSNGLILTKDILVNTPSFATNLISFSAEGPRVWYDSNRRSLQDIETPKEILEDTDVLQIPEVN